MSTHASESTDELLRWRSKIRQYASGMLGGNVSSRADTSDVTQEALLQFWKDQSASPSSEEPQKAAMAKKMARGHAAKLRRFHTAKKRDIRKSEPHTQQDETTTNPPSLAIQTEELQRLAVAVDELDDRERDIFFYYFYEDLSFRTISEKLGLTERVVRGVYDRSLKRLWILLDA